MAKKKKNKKERTPYLFNKGVDSIFMNTEWQIDEQWGLRQLSQYVDQIDTASKSSGIGDLIMEQIKLEKKNQMPQFVNISNGSFHEIDTDNPEAEIPKNSVALLKLKGVMRMDDTLSHRGVSSLCKDIQLCNSNPNIVAAVLEVDSGGGLSLAGQLLKNGVNDSRIPIVMYGHFVGSAAVHGTLPCDYKMLAGASSEMGSIGSMITINKRMVEFYKESYEDLYSKVSPKKNFAWREYLKGNKGPLIDSVTNNAISFQSEVIKYTNLNPATQDDTLQGGMFAAEDAIQRGLADGTGTLNDAINMAYALGTNTNINTDSNINSSTIKKQNNMFDYKAAWIQMIGTLNTVFGYEMDSNADPKLANEKMSLQQSLVDFKNSIVAEVSTNLNSMIDDLKKTNETLSAKVAKLEKGTGATTDNSEKLEKLEKDIEMLKASNETLTTEKKDLETQVASLQGKDPDPKGGTTASNADKGNTAPNLNNGAAANAFNANIDALQEVEGEAEYS